MMMPVDPLSLMPTATNHHLIVMRRASPDDADIVSALTAAAYATYISRLGRKPQPMTADYRHLATDHLVWLLYLGNQPAGVLVLMFEAEAVLIYSVAISPSYQKQGWGRYLLDWAEQQAQQAGYSRLRLYTNALMVENIALYQRLGYVETGRESYLGSTLVHMAKSLRV
jgi:ribosomal protein S18 acetylase RimI-like enzyme